MKSIWEFNDYKTYLKHWLDTVPQKRHGMNAKIAKILSIHTTMVSHILNGDSHLNTEQALKLCQNFLFLSRLETRTFVLLVQKERAGNQDAKLFFTEQIQELRNQALSLKERLPIRKTLDTKDQAIFYSDWYYSGIRLASALPGKHTVRSLAEQFNISTGIATNVVHFLLETGLAVEQNGKINIGEFFTNVGRDSPFVNRHHINWRLKVLSDLNLSQPEDLHFTNPVTISKSDFLKIREFLVKTIAEFCQAAEPSPAEELACLNLDWVRILTPEK